MARGKKLTYHQRELMKRNGITDCTDWLYIKQETIDENGSNNLSHLKGKATYITVRNTVTGEERKILSN